MDQTPQTEVDLKEDMKQVMATLPPLIRKYLSEGRYTPVAQNLMAKYRLRIDQGSVLERELMLLLMGIEDPSGFIQALTSEANLDQQTVNSVIKDINDQVFVPLRKEEEAMTKAAAQPAGKPVPPPAPKPAAPLPPHVAPLPPKMAMPKSGSLGDIVRRIAPPASIDASKLLEDHEEPHIDLKASAPAPKAPPAPMAKPVPPLAPMVGEKQDGAPTPQPAVPQPVVKPVPPTPPAPPVPKIPIPPPVTSYTVDPYREPLDEK